MLNAEKAYQPQIGLPFSELNSPSPTLSQQLKKTYRIISHQIGQSQTIHREINGVFDKQDFLGRTWYQMRKELDACEHQMPETTKTIIAAVWHTLAYTWFQKRQVNNIRPFSPTALHLNEGEIDQIMNCMDYDDKRLVTKMIVNPIVDIRQIVRYLEYAVNQRCLKAYDSIRKYDQKLADEIGEKYEIGEQIAWDRWRSLSTQA